LAPSLEVTRRFIDSEISRLEAMLRDARGFPASLQYLMAEMILIRAASLLESALAEIAYKIAAGSLYLDGSTPQLLSPCRSMSAARTAMLTIGRAKQVQSLKWTRTKFISWSVGHVINPTDHYVVSCTNFGSRLAEIFKVRNFAAHRTNTAKTDFKEVVRTVYGRSRNIQLGYFLLSTNYVQVENLVRYLVEIRTIVNDTVKR
jgi:hypothetical protein